LAGKVKMARQLRAETVMTEMTVAWIAERLSLGGRNDANLLLPQVVG
jgi:hypothetical protein